MIFDKGTQTYHGEKGPSSTDIAGESGYPHKSETRSLSSPCFKINSTRIKDLNIWTETLKQLQEDVGNTLEWIGIKND
jgi:hypothetical protein